MANTTETLYKIRDPKTGLFSKGGYSPVSWTKKGKIWRALGPIKNHLYLVDRDDYAGCDLVTLEVVTTEANLTPIATLLDARDKKVAADKKARENAKTKAKENRERKHARKLIAKWGPNP